MVFNDSRATLAYVAGASALVGGVAGYLLASHKSRRTFDARLDTELELARKHYKRRLAQLELQLEQSRKVNKPGSWTGALRSTLGTGVVEDADTVTQTSIGFDPEPESAVGPDGGLLGYRDEVARFATQSAHSPLEGLEGDGPDEDDEVDLEGGVAESSADSPASATPHDTSRPYLISTEEFCEDYNSFQKLSLTYYIGDGVLLDDKQEPVPDKALVVGLDNVEVFEKSYDPDALVIFYVRNHRLEIDFEVAIHEDSWVNSVLHYGDPAKQPTKVKE
jgi:hypothetical protein